MPENPTSPRFGIQLGSRFLWSLLVAESAILSLLHHRYNFWGWSWTRQLIIVLVIAPTCAFILEHLLSHLWPDLLRVSFRRWLLFLLPAVGISGFVAWHFLYMPEIEHSLEIVPSGRSGAAPVRLSEIRAAYGSAVPLSTFAGKAGWRLEQGLLISSDVSPTPIRYPFVGPINEQVRIDFVASPHGGPVQVTVDGRQVTVNLNGPEGDERRARLDTAYRWGTLNTAIVPLILVIDICTVLSLLVALWLMQEVTQKKDAESGNPDPERFLSHLEGLVMLCAIAVVLHTINFLSVPLTVLKDSPSYLQGAVYWIQNHSLDGVSSYRGLGTTLLFTPAMAPFGRNPLGLKFLLHLLAIACVPLSYRVGWQLGQRRWFAFAAGLLTALIPDLYAYSSFVLSEGPHVFAGLLFCTLLLSALRTLSPGWILATLMAGSFAVLVRSENLAAFLIGIGFILAKLIWQQIAPGARSIRPWQLGLAVFAAALPLLAWSAHNQRVYGFFGLSDFAGAALYDGWVYFGERSHIPIADRTSEAVQAIDAAYGDAKPGAGDVPTSWSVYYLLRDRGYTSEQAFSILQKATEDSIRKDPAMSWKLLLVKLRQGFEPHPFIPATARLPGEQPGFSTLNADYFDGEGIFVPPLIYFQRWVDNVIGRWYESVFGVWFWLGAVMLFICLYRLPSFEWTTIIIITANSVLLPTIIGMSMWRYVLLGMILMQYPLLAGIQSAGRFVRYYLLLIRPGGFRPKSLHAS